MSSKNAKADRFVGWQLTPIHQASFGSTTKGGAYNQKFKFKHSTGSVQEVAQDWVLLDASKLPVGRLATLAASILSGKYKPSYTPGAGSGDSVIIINAAKAFFTSNKDEKKLYYRHTGYMGGLKMETAGEALAKHPEKVIYDAVKGMLPGNRLSRYRLTHLKIYKDAEHPHSAQKPRTLNLEVASTLKKLGEMN